MSLPTIEMVSPAEERRERLAWVYAAALDQTSAGRGAGDPTHVVRVVRITQELVDLSAEDPEFFLSLAGLRDTGDLVSEHAVAVAVLAIALGRRLGLPQALLADVGLAALSPAAAPEQDGPAVEAARLLELAALGRSDASALRQGVIAADRLRDWSDGDGSVRPHLLAQILRVCEDFDAHTRGRRGAEPLPPDRAAGALGVGRGTVYQAELLDAFLDLIGVDLAVPSASAGVLRRTRRRTEPAEVQAPTASAAPEAPGPPSGAAPKGKRLGALKLKRLVKRRP